MGTRDLGVLLMLVVPPPPTCVTPMFHLYLLLCTAMVTLTASPGVTSTRVTWSAH